MNVVGAANKRAPGALATVAIAFLLAGPAPARAASGSGAPAAAPPPPASFHSQKEWRDYMKQVPTPAMGCFEGTYPLTDWVEVPCTTAPAIPYPPARGRKTGTIGNGNDFSAKASNLISEAVGSFDRVAGVTSETGTIGGPNAYTIQLNANFFTTTVCNSAAVPSQCQGWQQFIYASFTARGTFMQYWLINYGKTCPSGWNQDQADCYKNSMETRVPLQSIGSLAHLELTGSANAGGTDRVVLSTGSRLFSASGEDSVVRLADGWKAAEFNIFGDSSASEAVFNKGSTLVVRTSINDGGSGAPTCLSEGFTGETNNLTAVKSATPAGGTMPAIVFTESNAAGAPTGKICHALAGN